MSGGFRGLLLPLPESRLRKERPAEIAQIKHLELAAFSGTSQIAWPPWKPCQLGPDNLPHFELYFLHANYYFRDFKNTLQVLLPSRARILTHSADSSPSLGVRESLKASVFYFPPPFRSLIIAIQQYLWETTSAVKPTTKSEKTKTLCPTPKSEKKTPLQATLRLPPNSRTLSSRTFSSATKASLRNGHSKSPKRIPSTSLPTQRSLASKTHTAEKWRTSILCWLPIRLS